MNKTEYEILIQNMVYKQGFIDGLEAYAWSSDGKMFVGTCGTTLKDAVDNVENCWNYRLRKENQ